MDLSQVLKDGQIYYYYSPGRTRWSDKYGLCTLLEENLKCKIVMFDELKVICLDPRDNRYTFYSDLSEIRSYERSYYISGIKYISDKAVRELLPYLLTRDWISHSPRNSFTSIEAFLHHIVSLSANSTMIKLLIEKASIDWGYVDNKGNSFIHAACLLEKNDDLAQIIVTNTISQDRSKKLINSCNSDNLSALALCIHEKNPSALLIELLAKNGATLTLPKSDTRELILNDKFSISYENKELMLIYPYKYYGITRINVVGYICSNLKALHHCQIFEKVQKGSENLTPILRKKFDILLQSNCPQLLDYVFNPANHLISKLDRDINGNSILHIAVRNATPVILQHILSDVTNWRIVNDDYDNLLHTSIRSENFENLKVLLNTIPTYCLQKLINTCNYMNLMPFNMMINEPRSYESISIALSKECVDGKGNNFIHIAIEKGKFECLQYLVTNSDKKFTLSKNSLGFTSLELAITKSCVKSVELLLEYSSESLGYKNGNGCNCLHSSIIQSNITIFKMILSAVLKFDKELIDENIQPTHYPGSYKDCPTPFLLSIQLNHLEATKLLVCEGVNIRKSDKEGKNLFDYISDFSKNYGCLEKLLAIKVEREFGSSFRYPAEIQDLEINRNNVLFYFYLKGDINLFKKCFEALSLANKFRKNQMHNTILQMALENSENGIIEYLLRKLLELVIEAKDQVNDHINSVNCQGETALSQAVRNSMHSYVSLILDLGADIHKIYPNNNNILHIANNKNDSEMKRILFKRPEISNLFSSKNDTGEVSNIRDCKYKIPLNYLYVASGKNQTDKLTVMNSCSSLISVKDNIGRTPVFYAVIENNVVALEALLIARDINLLDTDNDGKTIMHLSIEKKEKKIWKILFSKLMGICEKLIECKKDFERFETSLLAYSIKQNNLTAFQDILSLNSNLNAVDIEGNTLLHLAALSPKTQQILNSLLQYLRQHRHEKAHDITCSQNDDHLAPFHLSILHNNIPAIDLFLRYDVPLVFYDKQSSQFTICSKNSPLTLHLCKKNNHLFIGYKVVDQVSCNKIMFWILTEIPKLNSKALKCGSREIDELTTLSERHIRTILKYPSPEPILTFLHTKFIPETLQFTNNCSMLHLAAKFGSIEVVSELSKSMKLEELDQNMESVLFYALENGEIKNLQILLSKISENTSKIVNNENTSEKRIIEVTIDTHHFEAFKCLLKRDFQVELTYRNKNGLTLLHKIIQDKKETKFFQALLEEIKARNPEFLTEYINSPKHSSKETALHLCLQHKQKDMLKILLNLNPNFSCEDENKNTPLHSAIKLNIGVDLIIDSIKKLDGDNLSLINAVNNKKLTPLHLAIINHDQPSVELLLNGNANLYAIDTEMKSILHYAVEIKDEISCQSVIEFLFRYERDHPSLDNNLLHMQDNAGSTALHMTVKKSKTSTTKLLIQQNPNLMLKDDEGKTVLHHSVCNDDPDIFSILMEYIARTDKQAINAQDSQGNTPLHLAIKLKRNDSLKKLVAIKPALDLKNELGLTPLHLAVLQGEDVLDQVLQAIELQSSDVHHHLDVLNNEGIPPLHYAIMNASNIALIRKLVEKGAKLRCQDNTGVITLFDGKGGLDLCIVKQVKRELKHKYVSQVVTDFGQKLIGYRARLIPFWILTELHTLNDVKIEEDKSTIERVNSSLDYNDTVVSNILKCESIDPVRMVIEKRLLNNHEKDEEGGNKLLNFASEINGSIAVINFIKSTSLSLDEICSWIKKSVSNLKVLRIIFESIPDYDYVSIIKDSSELSGEDLKRNKIAIALSNALLSCLEDKSNEIFTFLLSKNLCLNMRYGNNKDTLLHSMIKLGKSEDFVTLFLDKVKEYENNRNEKLLINGEPLIDAQNSNSETALTICILKNQEQNFNAILNYDPSLTLKDKSGGNILHSIAKTGNKKIADILLKISGKLECLFHLKNSEGCIPLHIAIENGHERIAEMLLEQRSDFYSQDDVSRTVLHHALLIQDQTTQSSMIKFILDYEKNNFSKQILPNLTRTKAI